MSIAENIARVRERIAAVAKRAGRRESDVALMAVCKTFPAEAIREAYQAGQRLFGENRVQEFAEKAPKLADLAGLEMHLIGHLQSNKANKAAELFSAVDSVDSLKVAERLNAAAAKSGKRLPVLIEVNVGGEEAKSGVPATAAGVEEIVATAGNLVNLEIRGLMTVPPYTENPDGARLFFRKLRELRNEVSRASGLELSVLSMGMSHDFEVAIEEGSTCVRVGTAIFGTRPIKQ
ncbi:MAG TPA: YggS family pyridoxal phosphate-dependent enzyme [Terriglobales bacterium]|nr:YggS family pyridoxal phosphate-dependent enzyme [Terriglobales bacterium]